LKPGFIKHAKAMKAAPGDRTPEDIQAASKSAELKHTASERANKSEPGSEPGTYFLPYQIAWIKDDSRLKICEKGRQIGLSYADSYDSVRKAARKNGRDVWVMSRDEVQAKQYIVYCKRWANVLKYAAQDLGEQVFTMHNGRDVCIQVLKFASGANIYALTSNPDAIVGKTGHVKQDEFALHRDQRQLFAVSKPVIQWGGTYSILSTHRGIGTVFNQIITDIKEHGNKMGWSLHTIPIQRAVEDGLVEKIDVATGGDWSKQFAQRTNRELTTLREFWLAQQRAECIDEEQWLQEYCCIPADEATAFISYEMITSCEESGLRLMSVDEFIRLNENRAADAATYYLGLDVARKKDLCVLDVGELQGDVMWDRVRLELQNKKFREIRDTLYSVMRLPQVRRGCIDSTGLGMQLAEEAQERFGWRSEPVTFTPAVKEELAFSLRGSFEDRKLRIPHDEKLRADLRGVKKEVTAANNIRFVGDSDDSHCDRFWAKALRQHAAHQKGKAGRIMVPTGHRAQVMADRRQREVLA